MIDTTGTGRAMAKEGLRTPSPGSRVKHKSLGACTVLHVDNGRASVQPDTPIPNPSNIPGLGQPWVSLSDVEPVS